MLIINQVVNLTVLISIAVFDIAIRILHISKLF